MHSDESKFVASHLNYLDDRLRLDYTANAFSIQQDCETSIKNNEMDKSEQYSDFSNNSTSISNINDNNSIANSACINSTDNSIIDSTHSTQNNSKVPDLSYSISDDTSNNPLNFQENWMGLNKDTRKFSIKKNHT